MDGRPLPGEGEVAWRKYAEYLETIGEARKQTNTRKLGNATQTSKRPLAHMVSSHGQTLALQVHGMWRKTTLAVVQRVAPETRTSVSVETPVETGRRLLEQQRAAEYIRRSDEARRAQCSS